MKHPRGFKALVDSRRFPTDEDRDTNMFIRLSWGGYRIDGAACRLPNIELARRQVKFKMIESFSGEFDGDHSTRLASIQAQAPKLEEIRTRSTRAGMGVASQQRSDIDSSEGQLGRSDLMMLEVLVQRP